MRDDIFDIRRTYESGGCSGDGGDDNDDDDDFSGANRHDGFLDANITGCSVTAAVARRRKRNVSSEKTVKGYGRRIHSSFAEP